MEMTDINNITIMDGSIGRQLVIEGLPRYAHHIEYLSKIFQKMEETLDSNNFAWFRQCQLLTVDIFLAMKPGGFVPVIVGIPV